jgi:hypothetical protein
VRAAAGAGLVVLAAAAGVGGTLLYQSATDEPKPAGDGLGVICTQHLTDCWQGGAKVAQPRDNEPCVRATDVAGYWHSTTAGPTVRQGFVYYCVIAGEDADE